MDFLKKMIAADTTISSVKKNPALAYLARLGSSRSVITISNCLKHIANFLGAKDIETADWSKLKRIHWTEIQKQLAARGGLRIDSKSLFDGVQNRCKGGVDIGSAASVFLFENPSNKRR